MLNIRRPSWLSIAIIILTLLLNIIIIKTEYDSNNDMMPWMLLVSIPLFIISIFNKSQIDHLIRKCVTDSMEPSSSHFKWISHSTYPNNIASSDLKVQIGNDQCSQPYDAHILNMGSMEDADLENEHSAHSADEGLHTYHLAAGGLVWQIGPAYLGCRTENGHFNSEAFKRTAQKQEIKMIELELSTPMASGHQVAPFMDVVEPIGKNILYSIFSDSAFKNFRDAEGMIHFLNNLRELSGGKPIGIRICIKNKKDFYQICHAVRKTQLIPDFIVVEGSPESNGVIQSDQAFCTGLPLYDALLFVSQTLQVYGLQKKISVIADGKITSSFDVLKVVALGANVVCTSIPRYTAIRYPGNGRRSFLYFKGQNVRDFHVKLMKDTVDLMNMCGFNCVSDITLSKFFSRLDLLHEKNLDGQNASVIGPIATRKTYHSKN